MRTLRLFIALLGVSIYLLSCDKENEKITLTNNYFPLEIGNYWDYGNGDKREIVGTKLINNKTYYLLKTQYDTIYYRIENNKVFALDYKEKESVIFDLSAEINESWSYHSYEVTLTSKIDTAFINNQKIPNCYGFWFDIPATIDDEHYIYLAPGIGLIKTLVGEGPSKELHKAKIGSLDINF